MCEPSAADRRSDQIEPRELRRDSKPVVLELQVFDLLV
jgi:hypothetical protein